MSEASESTKLSLLGRKETSEVRNPYALKAVVVPSRSLTPEEQRALLDGGSPRIFYTSDTSGGCAVCGAASGAPCTKACDDDSVPDGVAMLDADARRAASEGLKGFAAWLKPNRADVECGPGIAGMRPDNNVAHLDEDLLCEDA